MLIRHFMGSVVDAFTKVLLHFTDSNNGTTFTNSIATGPTFARGGTPVVSTAQSKFSPSSGAFLSTGFIEASALTTLGDTAAWTIDFWVRPETTQVVNGMLTGIFATGVTLNDSYGLLYGNPTSNLVFYVTRGTSAFLIFSAAHGMTAGAWNHIAVVRESTTVLKMYVNGTAIASVSNFSNFNNGAGGLTHKIGAVSATTYKFNGYIDEFRISKGIARWTGNFTPPTAPYTP